jgi:hypothetical protein
MFAVGPHTTPARYSWASSLLFLASKAVWLTGYYSISHIFPSVISIVGCRPVYSSNVLQSNQSADFWRFKNTRYTPM